MKQTPLLLVPLVLGSLLIISDARTNIVECVVDLKSANGTILKGTYFDVAKSGPGVLLFHQSNRTRKSWDDVARQLAAAGINALTVDTDPNKTRKQRWPGELDAAFEFLVSQPGVNRDVVGIGGAGVIGVVAHNRSDPLWAEMNKARARVAVEICYCSTLGECWTLRSGGLTGASSITETRRCLTPLATSFQQ